MNESRGRDATSVSKEPGFAPVEIEETTERWSEIRLKDGAVLRIKPIIVGADRVEGQFDPEGNPLYRLKSSVIMVVQSAPESLRRKAT